jgi:hypothetical protein
MAIAFGTGTLLDVRNFKKFGKGIFRSSSCDSMSLGCNLGRVTISGVLG